MKREKLLPIDRPLAGDENRKSNRGRRPGVGGQMRSTTVLKDAIIYAATKVGRDGKGLDGLVGYLVKLAIEEPKSFAPLLAKVIPLHVTSAAQHEIIYRTVEEVQEELRARGIAIDRIFH